MPTVLQPAGIRVDNCSREQALHGSGLPEAADEYDELYSPGEIWRARETRTGVTTVGKTKYDAIRRLADALEEYDEYGVKMGEFWWVLDVK